MTNENAESAPVGQPDEAARVEPDLSDNAAIAPGAIPQQEVAQPVQPSHSRRNILIGAGAALVVAVIVGLIVFFASQPTTLERVAAACEGSAPLALLTDDDGEPLLGDDNDGSFDEYFDGAVTIEDDGDTLIVRTLPDDDDPLGVSSLALTCVQEELDMPTWLSESISTTRALDGRQDEEWDGFTAQWGYHPDNGLNLIVVQR